MDVEHPVVKHRARAHQRIQDENQAIHHHQIGLQRQQARLQPALEFRLARGPAGRIGRRQRTVGRRQVLHQVAQRTPLYLQVGRTDPVLALTGRKPVATDLFHVPRIARHIVVDHACQRVVPAQRRPLQLPDQILQRGLHVTAFAPTGDPLTGLIGSGVAQRHQINQPLCSHRPTFVKISTIGDTCTNTRIN